MNYIYRLCVSSGGPVSAQDGCTRFGSFTRLGGQLAVVGERSCLLAVSAMIQEDGGGDLSIAAQLKSTQQGARGRSAPLASNTSLLRAMYTTTTTRIITQQQRRANKTKTNNDDNNNTGVALSRETAKRNRDSGSQ